MTVWRVLKQDSDAGLWDERPDLDFETQYNFTITASEIEILGQCVGAGKVLLLSDDGNRYEEITIHSKTVFFAEEPEPAEVEA